MRDVVIDDEFRGRLLSARGPAELAGLGDYFWVFGRFEPAVKVPRSSGTKVPRLKLADADRLLILRAGPRRVRLTDTTGRPVGVVAVDDIELVGEDFDRMAAEPHKTYTTAEVLAYCRARAGQAPGG